MTRELDALVAEKVMEYSLSPLPVYDGTERYDKGDGSGWLTSLAHYSTSIVDAWMVVEKMLEDGYYVDIHHDLCAWSAEFIHADKPDERFTADWKQSLEAQICEAALKAVEHEND